MATKKTVKKVVKKNVNKKAKTITSKILNGEAEKMMAQIICNLTMENHQLKMTNGKLGKFVCDTLGITVEEAKNKLNEWIKKEEELQTSSCTFKTDDGETEKQCFNCEKENCSLRTENHNN